MSKIALEGNASGTGTFTIASPNSNSNYTLTLPSSTGTVVVTGGAQTIEFAAGSAASPSITFTGDTNTGIFSPGADTIAFAEGGAEAMRIDSSGNVGIGTSSPTDEAGYGRALDIRSATGAAIYLRDSDDTTNDTLIVGRDSSNSYIDSKSGALIIYNAGSERMRIDSSGNVGIGTSSPAQKLDVTGGFIQSTNTTAASQIRASNTGGLLALVKDNSTGGSLGIGAYSSNLYSDGAYPLAFWTNGSERARITSGGSFGIGTSTPGARFQVLNQITITGRNLIGWIGGASGWNTNGYEELGVGYNGIRSIYTGGDNWALAFSTGTSAQFAAGTQAERARITSDGDFLVRKTTYSDSGTVGCYLAYDGSVGSTRAETSNTHSSYNLYSTGASAYRFYVGMAGTIYATSTTISAISDQRLKENIQDIDVGLDAVMALKPRKFDWKEGKGKDKKGDRGWIAQEFEQVFPDMIDVWKDEPPEGEEPYKAVNADLIPVLVKAIQELKAITDAQATRIEALEAEVAALKGQ